LFDRNTAADGPSETKIAYDLAPVLNSDFPWRLASAFAKKKWYPGEPFLPSNMMNILRKDGLTWKKTTLYSQKEGNTKFTYAGT
jgi:uncharacterized protein (DUF2126 family)